MGDDFVLSSKTACEWKGVWGLGVADGGLEGRGKEILFL